MALQEVLHLIDGRPQKSLSGRTFETVNPATGKPIADVAFGEAEDMERAVASAWAAYEAGVWRDVSPGERANRLRRLAELVGERVEEIAELETRDSGKPLTAARGDVEATVGLLEYVSTLPQNVRGAVHADDAGYFTHSRREPYGVVGAIAPWNFPFMNAVWKTGPPLSVGNSVVLKMAEQTPLSTALYGELALEAGIPAGVLNIVHGDGPTTGAALAGHPRVPKITFTGSTEVGTQILHAAAPYIKSCHLELGGKTANIVFDDADLDQALAGSLFTSFFNSGQICTSGSRLLVHEAIAPDFLERLTQRATGLRVGDPLADTTDLGPLVSDDQLARVEGYVRSGVESGAALVTGGHRPEHTPADGYFYSPSIFTDVAPDMVIAQEEIFGPVLSVMTFSDEAGLTALANGVGYGLAATVWTNRLDRALRMIDELDAGIVWTNCAHHLTWNAPYEGHKLSGLGEDLGLEAIATFTKLKVSYVNISGSRLEWGGGG